MERATWLVREYEEEVREGGVGGCWFGLWGYCSCARRVSSVGELSERDGRRYLCTGEATLRKEEAEMYHVEV